MPSNQLTVTVPLSVPITHGDEVITEVTLNEPDLGGLMALDDAQGNVGQALATIMACTGWPPSVVKQLKLRDIKTIGEAAAKLMGEAQGTGRRQQRGSLTPFTGVLSRSNG